MSFEKPLYTIRGDVIRGAGQGRKLGFPTANLKLIKPYPRYGVYFSQVKLQSGETIPALTNIGVHPTLGALDEPIAETYLLEPQSALYQASITVELLYFWRDEIHFDSPQSLRRQIESDLKEAERYFRN